MIAVQVDAVGSDWQNVAFSTLRKTTSVAGVLSVPLTVSLMWSNDGDGAISESSAAIYTASVLRPQCGAEFTTAKWYYCSTAQLVKPLWIIIELDFFFFLLPLQCQS